MIKLKNKIFRNAEKTVKIPTIEVSAEEAECPDGGYGWVICVAAAAIQFIILGIHNNFGILYTYFMKDLNADPTDAGKMSPTKYSSSLKEKYFTPVSRFLPGDSN